MKTSFSEINQIVNPVKFQKIQDDIATATGLAIITVDYLGRPFTKHSNCSDFCKKVRSSEYGVYCEKCDSHGGLEAARIGKPFIYICHAGLVDFAIPIISNDLYLGAFMGGQILLSDSENSYQIERILNHIGNQINPSENSEIYESYLRLPSMDFDKINALANMLLHISNYCVKEAQLKKIISQNSSRQISDTFNSNDSRMIIAPAINYINKNLKEKITLEKMASVCNISTSYFSKLFSKENLGNLSEYVNQIKMEQAKKLLRETEFSVQRIAEDLGFDDCGYFIKVFKKLTTKTPTEYRIENS